MCQSRNQNQNRNFSKVRIGTGTVKIVTVPQRWREQLNNFTYTPANHHNRINVRHKERGEKFKKQQHLLIGPPVQALQTLTNESS
jgi:hypothetical protein